MRAYSNQAGHDSDALFSHDAGSRSVRRGRMIWRRMQKPGSQAARDHLSATATRRYGAPVRHPISGRAGPRSEQMARRYAGEARSSRLPT